MVVRQRLCDHPRGVRRQDSLLSKPEVVAVEDACCIAGALHQSVDSIALAANVVSVLPREHIEIKNLEIPVRFKSALRDDMQRDQRGLGGIPRAYGDAPIPKVGDCPHGSFSKKRV